MILDGMRVFNFRITQVPAQINELLMLSSYSIESIDMFYLHQANRIMLETIRKKLKIPAEKCPYSLDLFGNTSSASIPLTICQSVANNDSLNPENAVVCGFGIGLSWASAKISLKNTMVLPITNIMNVQNKILIIGATSGIGSQISKELDNQYQLYLCGRNNDKLKIIKKILENKHTAIQLDICNNNDIDNLVAEISPVDGFVYCSGIAPAIPAKYIKETDIANVFDVNFIGAVKLVSELLKKKKLNSGASLVFISSEAVRQPYFGSALYSASKAALEAYSIALSKELGTKKIRVNCASPTYVEINA